ncbi:MAG: hypothetical protein H5T86_09540, partial [Armatimonadetes bacterium]|nr:hypothetical protein [Armatimonadota bacterium]
FRLGDRTVYYYSTGSGVNMAYLRLNGETYYELADGETEGFIETAAIVRPGEKWDRELIINAEPRQGVVKVEIIDVETERVISGFSRTDCDTIPDSVEHRARWKGMPLAEVTAECVRVRFWLSRSSADKLSPRLYGWKLLRTDPPRPQASELRVNGQVAPAGLTDPHPVFSWAYADPRGLAQRAYRILVASSQENLDAGVGDIWDSGPIDGADTQCQYGGPPLTSYRLYFWKVLVRNSEGVWSE